MDRAPSGRQRRLGGARATLYAGAVIAALVGAAGARPAARDSVTLQMVAAANQQSAWDILIPNFERVYPNVKVEITYAVTAPQLYQLETTELAAGNGPDLISTAPGCNQPISICALAQAGDLAPMTGKPWATRKRSLPIITSLTKHGPTLYGFEPIVAGIGMFTNDDLFKKLGLRVPQTFSELLGLCKQAAAHGTVAIVMNGAAPQDVSYLLTGLAVPTVYGTDKHWTGEQKAGKRTFAGSSGWQQALQSFLTLNNAGCFQPGMTGTSAPAARAEFAQGQGLIYPGRSDFKGAIDADAPQFSYSFHAFPAGASTTQTNTIVDFGFALSVNAHASAANQEAAQEFVDFVARPKQDALLAHLLGAVTQYEFLKNELPAFMSSLSPALIQGRYVIDPEDAWWNAGVLVTLEQDGIGLATGQETVDGLLNAMDAAWNQGPG